MRRALLLLSLVFSLALNQVGALAHAYQHVGDAKSAPAHSKHESGAPCGLCAAFVALEHAAAGPHALPAIVRETPIPLVAECRGIGGSHHHYFHQRAPPSVL